MARQSCACLAVMDAGARQSLRSVVGAAADTGAAGADRNDEDVAAETEGQTGGETEGETEGETASRHSY